MDRSQLIALLLQCEAKIEETNKALQDVHDNFLKSREIDRVARYEQHIHELGLAKLLHDGFGENHPDVIMQKGELDMASARATNVRVALEAKQDAYYLEIDVYAGIISSLENKVKDCKEALLRIG